MSNATVTKPGREDRPPPNRSRTQKAIEVARGGWLLLAPILLAAALVAGFLFLKSPTAPRLLVVVVAIVWAVGGAIAIYALAASYISRLRGAWQRRLAPIIFIAPATFFLGLYLVYPTLETLYLSFFGPNSQKFVGLNNYVFAFTNPSMVESFRNNALWLVLGTGGAVTLGLIIAALAERTAKWFALTVKTLVFMPLAISLVGASIIWLFVYAFRPAGSAQIGLLNAIWTGLGGSPQAWLLTKPWNTIFLIVILIWIQTGFAMVIFDAALRGVSTDLIDAARVDGGSELQVFLYVTLPSIRGTIIMVTTTIVIFTLKIFDIVLTMTGGNYGTQVIANAYYQQEFQLFQPGRASAIAIILLVLVTPVMWYNLRSFRRTNQAIR